MVKTNSDLELHHGLWTKIDKLGGIILIPKLIRLKFDMIVQQKDREIDWFSPKKKKKITGHNNFQFHHWEQSKAKILIIILPFLESRLIQLN